MNLFGNKKEEHDTAQTNSVKEAAANNLPAPSSSPFEQQMPQTTQQNPFNNPFSQNNTNSMEQQNPNTFTPQANQVPQQSPFENNQPPQTSMPQNQTSNDPFAQQNQSNFPTQANQVPQQSPFENNQQQNSFDTFQQTQQIEQNQNMDMDKVQEMIDETVEKIIEERWDKLVTNIDKVVKWKDKVDNQMNLIKEDIVTMRNGFDELEKKLINKISNYDRNILDVNSEIKALEKVFQKITPTLVNNVNELSRIADELKKPSAKENFQNK